jgi:glucose/arabinose dehydrogenase/mono/diheme cytochrome c family protein
LPAVIAAQAPAPDWRADWALADGFTLRRDANGFRFPTAIAFVPHPGRAPGDPLYYITELQGTIKVVANDRAVRVFATVSTPTEDTLPAQSAEVGLAGICLEPTHGYVFATFAYRDSTGVLRNALVRYQTTPRRFGLRPRKTVLFREPFGGDMSAVSHQIGPCQATPEGLFVSVGDGEQELSQDLRSTLGKILRMSHNARPLATNPFYDRGGNAAYVWALGLRNPFGLKLLADRLLVADNGDALDRFLEIERGRNYLWDGSDRSIGANAAQVFGPAVSPVQLDYCSASGLPAGWRNRFYVALSGRPSDVGQDAVRRGKGVMRLDYGLVEHRMRSVPEYLVRYRGTHHQAVVGLGCGPDGIYFVPIFPDTTGESAVVVVRYAPGSGYPYPLFGDTRPSLVMDRNRCFGCHSLGGTGGTVGPRLDYDSLAPRLRARLGSAEYRARIAAVDSLSGQPFTAYHGARARVLATSGDERLFTWVHYHLLEPKFDNPSAQMPNLGLPDADAVSVAQFLLTPPAHAAAPPATPRRPLARPPKRPSQGRVARLIQALPLPRAAQVALAFVGGLVAGVVLVRGVRR